MTVAPANRRDGAGRSSRVSPEAARSPFATRDQHQRLTHTELGQSLLGMCAPILAVDYAQDWSASCRAGFHRPVELAGLIAPSFSRNSHRLVSSPSRRRAFRGSTLLPDNRGARHLIRATGANRSRAQSVSDQHLHKLAVPKIHDHPCLSLSPRLRPHQHGRRLEVWRHQISVMRCLA